MDGDATTLLLALGKAVIAIWSNLSQDVQHELFEHAVSVQDDATRERLAVFRIQCTFARLMRSRPAPSRNPTVLGDNPSTSSGKGSGFSLRRPRGYGQGPPPAEGCAVISARTTVHGSSNRGPGRPTSCEPDRPLTAEPPGRMTRPTSPWFEIGTAHMILAFPQRS